MSNTSHAWAASPEVWSNRRSLSPERPSSGAAGFFRIWEQDDDPEAQQAHSTINNLGYWIDAPGEDTRASRLEHQILGAINAWAWSSDSAPVPLQGLWSAFEASRAIVGMPVDPEDPNGERYTNETWERARRFLTDEATWLWRTSGRVTKTPEITPGPDGSIDIHWDRPAFELLISIPSSANETARFYGDDRGRNWIKGAFELGERNMALVLWLDKVRDE